MEKFHPFRDQETPAEKLNRIDKEIAKYSERDYDGVLISNETHINDALLAKQKVYEDIFHKESEDSDFNDITSDRSDEEPDK